MDEITLSHPQHGQKENLTLDWVQRHRSNTLDDFDDETHGGLASRLYLLCLDLLRRIFSQQESPKKGSNALREELGKFYLWGREYADGKLDEALEYSEDVKIEVLDSLGSVGRSLLRIMALKVLEYAKICILLGNISDPFYGNLFSL